MERSEDKLLCELILGVRQNCSLNFGVITSRINEISQHLGTAKLVRDCGTVFPNPKR
jgi:hypothetical protein